MIFENKEAFRRWIGEQLSKQGRCFDCGSASTYKTEKGDYHCPTCGIYSEKNKCPYGEEVKKITLETLYTPWTLDMYQTFTFDTIEESICENLEAEYDDIEWEYDKAGYLKALSVNLVNRLNDEICDDVILKIEQDGEPVSPAYYNFSTDEAWLVFTVNHGKLSDWIDEHKEAFEAEKIKSHDGFMWLGGDDETMLNYYLIVVSAKKYDAEFYIMEQLEQVEAYEYIEYEIIKK